MDKATGLMAEAAEKAEAGRVKTHTRQHEVAAKEGHVVGQHTVDESAAGQLRHLTQVDTSQELTTTLKRTAPQATQTAELQPHTVGVRSFINSSTACQVVLQLSIVDQQVTLDVLTLEN